MASQLQIASPLAPCRVSPRLLRTGALCSLLLLAFALRLIPVLFVPSLNWADEVFQTTEQAHRLVYGTGLVPWEFQLGIRSWLVPGAIAGLMHLARLLGDGPDYYLAVIAAGCDALAMVPVVCGFLWCERWFGLGGAFVGGLCVAVAPELVYMGARPLTEVIAAHVLVLALYLLQPGYSVTSPHRRFVAGALLGLAFVVRIQLAPAVGLVALWTVRHDARRRLPSVLAGGLAVLAFAALLDSLTLGSPLASIWRYVLYNVFYGASSTFGVEPWYWYGSAELAIWGGGLAIVLMLAAFGTRQITLPLVIALVIVAAHSVVAHKEYRFVYPAIVLLAIQAALGLAALANSLLDRTDLPVGGPVFRRAAVAALAVAWCGVALTTWNRPALAFFRQRAHDYLLLAHYVAHDPSICGLGLYGETAWTWYGGYSYLHRSVPLFWPKDKAELDKLAPAFDALLYSTAPSFPQPVPPYNFKLETCFGEACLARRPGDCRPAPPSPMPFPAPLAHLAPRR